MTMGDTLNDMLSPELLGMRLYTVYIYGVLMLRYILYSPIFAGYKLKLTDTTAK